SSQPGAAADSPAPRPARRTNQRHRQALATAPARGCCRAPTGDPVVVSAQAIGVRSASASSLVANTGAAIGLRGAAVEEDRFVVGREVASQRRADRCAV